MALQDMETGSGAFGLFHLSPSALMLVAGIAVVFLLGLSPPWGKNNPKPANMKQVIWTDWSDIRTDCVCSGAACMDSANTVSVWGACWHTPPLAIPNARVDLEHPANHLTWIPSLSSTWLIAETKAQSYKLICAQGHKLNFWQSKLLLCSSNSSIPHIYMY